MTAFSLRIVERTNWGSLIPQEVDHALRLRFGKLDKTAVQAVVTAQVDEDSPQSSPHLSPELLSLAEPARRKAKLPTAQMQTLVLHLCENRWLTARELADLLSRDADNLQNRILTGLVKQGLLELRHPGVPNRPDQAYRTVTTPMP